MGNDREPVEVVHMGLDGLQPGEKYRKVAYCKSRDGVALCIFLLGAIYPLGC